MLRRLLSWRKPAPITPRVEPALTIASRPVMRIRGDAIEAAQSRVSQPTTAFTVPTAAPGVAPKQTMAMDDQISALYQYAQGNFQSEGLGFLGYAYLSELAQRPEYRHISETMARELTRKWITLEATGGDDKTETIALLNAAFDRYAVRDTFRQAALIDGLFGRAQIYLDTGYSSDPAEMATPLVMDPAKIGLGGLKRLTVVEPIWTYPVGYNSTSPLQPDYYTPTSWGVMGVQVHASRLLTFVSHEMPDMLKPAYMFGGLSRSQMAKPYVDNWIRTRQSVSDLLHSFSTSVLSTDLSSVLNAGSGAALSDRAALFSAYRDNANLLVVDKESEAFDNVSAPLGTLDKLQAQAQEQMASVVGIPLVKLLGVTPSGLNASSDGEIRVFYDTCSSIQETLFRTPLHRVLQAIQLSELGHIDPAITFRFEPLWQLNETERSAVQKSNADTASVYITAGVISADEERKRLAMERGSLYPALDLNEPLDDLDGDDEDEGKDG